MKSSILFLFIAVLSFQVFAADEATKITLPKIIFGKGFNNSHIEVSAETDVIFSGYLTSQTENAYAATLTMPHSDSLKIEIIDLGTNAGVALEFKAGEEPFILVERFKDETGKMNLRTSKSWTQPLHY